MKGDLGKKKSGHESRKMPLLGAEYPRCKSGGEFNKKQEGLKPQVSSRNEKRVMKHDNKSVKRKGTKEIKRIKWT